MRLATPDDQHLPAYDYSTLNAVNMCPMWGIRTYVTRKRMPGASRAMALELGSAAHEAFAAVRLFQLHHYQGRGEQVHHHGPSLFGPDRWESLRRVLVDERNDLGTRAVQFALEAIYGSGFHDDPDDKRRTLANLEEATIAYVDRWAFDRDPVWVRHPDDPTSDIGVEVPFDLVVSFSGGSHDWSIRYIGKMDGLHEHSQSPGRLRVEENKTAGRLNDAWSLSFRLSHQITGYCAAATTFTGVPVDRAVVRGLAIPLPKSYDLGGIVKNPVERGTHHFASFFDWIYHTVNLINHYADNPKADPPQYTHSCNRYFRPCPLVPYCDGDDEEKARILTEMEDHHWSPLDTKAGD